MSHTKTTCKAPKCPVCRPVKKKAAKKRVVIGPGLTREVVASVALDGETQVCGYCIGGKQHPCGVRPMTAEERAVVEAALEWEDINTEAGLIFMEKTPHGILARACRALRAAREKEAKRG